MEKIKLRVTGMSCEHCEKALTNAMDDIGVKVILVSAKDEIAELEYDSMNVSIDKIKEEIKDCDFDVEDLN